MIQTQRTSREFAAKFREFLRKTADFANRCPFRSRSSRGSEIANYIGWAVHNIIGREATVTVCTERTLYPTATSACGGLHGACSPCTSGSVPESIYPSGPGHGRSYSGRDIIGPGLKISARADPTCRRQPDTDSSLPPATFRRKLIAHLSAATNVAPGAAAAFLRYRTSVTTYRLTYFCLY